VLIQPGFVINEESELAEAAFCIIDEAWSPRLGHQMVSIVVGGCTRPSRAPGASFG
jgi:hypothetical protein